MDKETLNKKNPFVKRTKLLGTYDMGAYSTSVSIADGNKVVFDITAEDKVLSFVVDRSIEYTELKNDFILGSSKHNRDYVFDYSVSSSINGEAGFNMKIKHHLLNGSFDTSTYDTDLTKGISEFDHNVILGRLKDKNSTLAKLWEKCVPDSEGMTKRNKINASEYNDQVTAFNRILVRSAASKKKSAVKG